MILSFGSKRTEQFARGGFVKAFQGFADQAERRLAILNAAPDLETLRNLPSNRLESLHGNRAGQFSIRTTSNGESVSSGLTGNLGQAKSRSWITIEEGQICLRVTSIQG